MHRVAQHVYASLSMSKETGTEAHPIVDNTQGQNGHEAEETVRRQDERICRQTRADDTNMSIIMDFCPAEMERHLVPDSDQDDTCTMGVRLSSRRSGTA